MAYGSRGETNKITQEEAIEEVRKHTSKKSEVIDLIINSTFYGKDYDKHEQARGMEMSYYCRAFNITAYGVTPQKNPIKNVYSKAKMFKAAGLNEELNSNPKLAEENYEKLENYFRDLLYQNWPGYQEERPYEMKTLLINYLKSLYDTEQKTDDDYFAEWRPEDKKGVPSKPESISGNDGIDLEAILSLPVLKKCAPFAVGIIVLLIMVNVIKGLLPGINAYYSEGAVGALEMVSALLFYGSIIYLIIILIKKLEKRKIGIAGAIFVMSFAVADFAEGSIGSVIVEVIIAIAVYEVIKWLTSGNSNGDSGNTSNTQSARKNNYSAAKIVAKRKKVKLDPIRVILMLALCYVGVSGVMNGGNMIIALIFIGIGIACLNA